MSSSRFEFHEVNQDRWDDLAALFKARGGPHGCWCMAWRRKPPNAKPSKYLLKNSLRSHVDDGVQIGILGYCANEPVAWCSIAPRSTYRPLGGPDDDNDNAVWSLTCFFVKRNFRGNGLIDQLIEAATAHAKNKGAKIVEAYPVDPDSPSYRFMGFVSAFERAGFEEIGMAGKRRHVMRRNLV